MGRVQSRWRRVGENMISSGQKNRSGDFPARARAAPWEGEGREDQAEMEESRMNVEELIPMIAELFSS